MDELFLALALVSAVPAVRAVVDAFRQRRRSQTALKESEDPVVLRKLVVDRAVELVARHYQDEGGVVTRGADQPWDLRVDRDGETRLVEVKVRNRQTDPLLLTPNEVAVAQSRSIDLAIVDGLTFEWAPSGLQAVGGSVRIIRDWASQLNEGTLPDIAVVNPMRRGNASEPTRPHPEAPG